MAKKKTKKPAKEAPQPPEPPPGMFTKGVCILCNGQGELCDECGEPPGVCRCDDEPGTHPCTSCGDKE